MEPRVAPAVRDDSVLEDALSASGESASGSGGGGCMSSTLSLTFLSELGSTLQINIQFEQ